jgi:sec-independent protein translocase protein TatB
MIDFGFDKIALIGAVALIVIGPEKLPRVARTVGTLMGKARRYVAEVKAEVNRTIELEELQKMKAQFETAARDVEQTVSREVNDAQQSVGSAFSGMQGAMVGDSAANSTGDSSGAVWQPPPPQYKRPNKHWRLKRSALPRWYKQRSGLRGQVQSGAARVARHRPKPLSAA